MFTKININQFGPYCRFRWQQKMKPFSRVNIIYGRNYSGKTTLSRIFDCVAQGTLHKDYAHGQFSLITGEDVATRKKMKARELKKERVELFQKLLEMGEKYKRKNQYQ